MGFTLEDGNKYACIALENAGVEDGFDEIHLGDDLWFLTKVPFELDEHWHKWMGSLRSESFASSNLVIIAKQKSTKPEILDEENKNLRHIVDSLFYALLMFGVPHYDAGLNASGARIKGEVNTREFGPIDVHYRPARVFPATITRASVESAAQMASVLRNIYAVPGTYRRFKRGFKAWQRGIQERRGDNMLHQCVRATEAFIRPPIGESRRKFAHRCQVFTTRSDQSRDVLNELYELRSRTEHMNEWDDVLSHYGPDKIDEIAMLRAYQAFLLANHVYRRLLQDPNVLDNFSSDDRIDDFWRKKEGEQDAIWGQKIDLDAEAMVRFRP